MGTPVRIQPGTALNIEGPGTTTVKSGSGVLRRIVIGTTAGGDITIYDSKTATGTEIGTLKASIAEGTYTYECAFSKGLTIVVAGGSIITVVYE